MRSYLSDRPLWPWVLAAVAAFCCWGTAMVFSPGYLSLDSVDQLQQALGKQTLTDWHPPVMALLWRALIELTGRPGALAALQALVLWSALWVIAWRVWARTGRKGGSLAVLAIGVAPYIVNFTGVVWKDVEMAFTLLAACAVAFVARDLPADRTRTRWVLLVVGVLFITYAILVRKNAVLAGLPVFYLLVRALWPTPGRRKWLVSVVALIAAAVMSSGLVSAVGKPVETRQLSQILLDDLVHVLSVDQVRKAAGEAATTPDFQQAMVTTAERCKPEKNLSDAYWRCYPRDLSAGLADLGRHADELNAMWISEIPRHLPQYAEYRLQVFSKVMFQGRYQFQNGSLANAPGIGEPDARRTAMLRYYVTGMFRDLPFLFAGWFWLAVGVTLSIRPGRGQYATQVRVLGISAALYMAGYLPTVPAGDFRYFYWPALAGTLGLLLLWVGRRTKAADGGAAKARATTEPEAERKGGTEHANEGEAAAGTGAEARAHA
ncbi:hypothetical protein ACF065_01285 [Streptomyces sp. NPDC015232]|uniref:hypothetical protein n=1 Tax=unclassified Streptomyces TaxID=2593676 RepID=UPI003700EC05